jgi:phage tail sheath protein FI
VLLEASPPLTLADLRAVQRAMIEHCEQRGDRLAVLDAPRDERAADPFDPDAVRDWRIGLESRFAALYWPWLQVTDTEDRRAASRLSPPSGHALGAFAASDLAFGAQKAPANAPLQWVQAVTREADETRRAMLNEAGINVIRALPSRGIRLYGARTLAPEPDQALLNVRRILILLRRALRRGLAWVPFEPDNAALRRQLRATLEGFLEDLWRRGSLAGAVAEEAFRVAFDPAGAAAEGELVIRIAVAPVRPAEFVLLTLTRSDEAVEIAEPLVPPGEVA